MSAVVPVGESGFLFKVDLKPNGAVRAFSPSRGDEQEQHVLVHSWCSVRVCCVGLNCNEGRV